MSKVKLKDIWLEKYKNGETGIILYWDNERYQEIKLGLRDADEVSQRLLDLVVLLKKERRGGKI